MKLDLRPVETLTQRFRRHMLEPWLIVLAAVKRDPLTLAESYSLCYAVVWGAWLINPWRQTFSSAGGFAIMAQLLSETTWGWSIVLLGFVSLVSFGSGNLIARSACAFTQFLLWIFVSVLMYHANPHGIGGISYFMISLIPAFVFVRLVLSRGLAPERAWGARVLRLVRERLRGHEHH